MREDRRRLSIFEIVPGTDGSLVGQVSLGCTQSCIRLIVTGRQEIHALAFKNSVRCFL